MKLKLVIQQVQHIQSLTAEFDFAQNPVCCVVGRNGCGKTTFIRALRNLVNATTFQDTASPNILNKASRIQYDIDDSKYDYTYNSKLSVLDSKQTFTQKNSLTVELPLPNGERFKYYQSLGSINEALQTKITEKSFEPANELIELYQKLYHLNVDKNRFSELKQVKIKGETYYFILLENDFYIRQDYFSSGEFFVLELFRLASKPNSLIVIDELDISLDAAAQVELLNLLRPILERSQSKLLFTTHSLALMKSLNENELYLMENLDGLVSVEPRSYAYIKATLFGFKGWDRIVLVEDIMAKDYLVWLIGQEIGQESDLARFNIIHIGGHQNVVDLFKRNQTDNYFNVADDSVICCLDGDQSGEGKYQRFGAYFLPFDSVEKRLCELHDKDELSFKVPRHEKFTNRGKRPKNIYEQIVKKQNNQSLMTKEQVFETILAPTDQAFIDFKYSIIAFLKLRN